uniref:YlxR family protein n=1 Tax=Cyanobium sp. TaxID=2164130 RepID=UPI004048CF15
MKPKPVLRRCVSCRELLNRQQLWRIIRLAEGGIGLDQGMGRSAYLCPNQVCLEEAKRRKRLQRALRCQVAETIVETLEQRLNTSADPASEAR